MSAGAWLVVSLFLLALLIAGTVRVVKRVKREKLEASTLRSRSGRTPEGRARIGGLLLLMVAVALLYVARPQLGWMSAKSPEPPGAELRRLVTTTAARYFKQNSLVSLAVVTVADGTEEIVCFGKRSLFGAPVDDSTLFEVASVTKSFTGLLLARRVEAGVVTLDEPVASLLPDSVPVPGATRRTITLQHLATHTSGLPSSPEIPQRSIRLGLAQFIGYDGYADYTERDFVASLATTTLQSEPGARWSYSNYGAGLLGYALSRDRGSYEAALRAEILEPLGMNATIVRVDEAHEARMARGYASSLRFGPIMFARPAGPLANHAPFAGAGSVRSTAADMLKYLKANMGMTSGPLHDAIAQSYRQLFRSAESGSIGMLWIVPRDSGIIWHSGRAPGFGSYMGFSNDGRFGVVVLAGTRHMVEDLGITLLQQMRRRARADTARARASRRPSEHP